MTVTARPNDIGGDLFEPLAPETADIPVEKAPEEPRDELVKALLPELDEQEEQDLSNRVLSDFYNAMSDREEWETRLGEWEDQYYNRAPDKDFPWPGASNFHVPLTMMGVETYKPRLTEAILGQTPPIIVVPNSPAGEDRKDKVETVLNWQVQNQLKLEPLVQQSAHLFLQPGIVYGKTTWLVERRRRKYIREFPATTPVQVIIEAIIGEDKLRELEPVPGDEMKWKGSIWTSPHAGGALEILFTIKVLDDPPTIQVLVDREEVTERPDVTMIEPVDIIAPARGGHTVAEQPWIQQRLWLREDDLRRMVLAKRFDEKKVQELLDAGEPVPDSNDGASHEYHHYRTSQDAAEGVDGDGASNVRQEEFCVLEDYRRYDIDGDGLEEEIIVWVATDLPGKVLSWDYLDNVYAHGRRPIRVGRFFPVPFRWYGLSYAEMIKGVQDEINTIHNQRVDYATIQNMPFGFKRASATLPPISQRLRPGEFIDVDNPQQDIFIPRWGGSPAWGQQEEATLMQYHERLSGLTDLSVGRQPNRVGATRTAAGTQTLLSEAGLRFKTATSAFQTFWLGIFEDILALDQEYLPPRMEFRITGKQPTRMMLKDRSEIRGSFDLRLAATSATMNRQQMRDDATVVLQAIMNPSLMQAGLIGLKGIRRALEDTLKAFGRDPVFYLEDKVPVRTPTEELMAFSQGQYIPPAPGENFEGHLFDHRAALENPSIDAETKKLIAKHIDETLELQRGVQMAQQMQQGQGGGGAPPVGQQAVNAQTGAGPQANVPQTPATGQQPQAAGMPGGQGGY